MTGKVLLDMYSLFVQVEYPGVQKKQEMASSSSEPEYIVVTVFLSSSLAKKVAC